MSDATESLAAWAARVAPTLDAEGWRTAEKDADDFAPVQWIRWTQYKARALLAYRDRVAAGLSEQMRRELLGEEHGCPWGSTAKALRDRVLARRKGPTDDHRTDWRTDFGREIARVLAETKR
jgi:hypothetical protein